MSQLQSNLVLMRLTVKDYILTTDEKNRIQFERYLKKTKIALDEIKNPDHQQKITQLNQLLVRYQKGFNRVVQLKKQRTVDLKVLHDNEAKVEKGLSKILSSAREEGNEMELAYAASLALKDLMLARLHSFQFLTDNKKESADAVFQNLKDLSITMDKIDTELKNRGYKNLLHKLMKIHSVNVKTFDTLEGAIFRQNSITKNILSRVGTQATTYIDEMKGSINSQLDSQGPILQHENQTTSSIILVVVLIATAGGSFVGFYIVRSTLRTLGDDPAAVTDIAHRVSLGELDMTMKHYGENPDSLYASMRHMIKTLKHKASLAGMIAAGDLSQSVQLASDNDTLGHSLQNMTDNLTDLLVKIQTSGEQISSGSEQISKTSHSLAEGATKQKENLDNISQSISELSFQTNANAESAENAKQFVYQAQEAINDGQNHMESMTEAMGEIQESSNKIAGFITTIDEIAQQTNLLALNAAIEAARAGDHGRGFAVVADEVRHLASRTTAAAEKTTTLILESEKKATHGVQIAENTAHSLQLIIDNINGTTEQVVHIAQASEEQTTNVKSVHRSLASIESITQLNVSASVESAASATELSAQTQSMKEMLERFTLRHHEDNVTI